VISTKGNYAMVANLAREEVVERKSYRGVRTNIKYLYTGCSGNNHVCTWVVVR
jgi:hypothetical protein